MEMEGGGWRKEVVRRKHWEWPSNAHYSTYAQTATCCSTQHTAFIHPGYRKAGGNNRRTHLTPGRCDCCTPHTTGRPQRAAPH
eukprot:scaffold1400_cov113-Isochrysis_galbana.AAC.4